MLCRLRQYRPTGRTRMPNVVIPTARGRMSAWLALPESIAQAPGVVVLHDVLGMTHDHRNQANWLADAGFLAVSPDLYYEGGRLLCVRQIIRDLTARTGPAFDNVESARTWVLKQPQCNGRVGVIGFCMGGGFALLLVADHGFSAASINYGGPLPRDLGTFLNAACPVVASYGARTRWEQGIAEQLAQALERAFIPHDVKEYPDAGHSFMNKHGKFAMALMRFTSMGWNEESAMDARCRIAAFFHTHLD